MAIVSKDHRCPSCNSKFRVEYDKVFIVKALDFAAKTIAASGGLGPFILTNQAIKGKDVLVRKITGVGRYKFTCPNCGYVSILDF